MKYGKYIRTDSFKKQLDKTVKRLLDIIHNELFGLGISTYAEKIMLKRKPISEIAWMGVEPYEQRTIKRSRFLLEYV